MGASEEPGVGHNIVRQLVQEQGVRVDALGGRVRPLALGRHSPRTDRLRHERPEPLEALLDVEVQPERSEGQVRYRLTVELSVTRH